MGLGNNNLIIDIPMWQYHPIRILYMYVYMHVFICNINVHVFVAAVMLASLCVCAYADMTVLRPTLFAFVVGISEFQSCEVFLVCAWNNTEEH